MGEADNKHHSSVCVYVYVTTDSSHFLKHKNRVRSCDRDWKRVRESYFRYGGQERFHLDKVKHAGHKAGNLRVSGIEEFLTEDYQLKINLHFIRFVEQL